MEECDSTCTRRRAGGLAPRNEVVEIYVYMELTHNIDRFVFFQRTCSACQVIRPASQLLAQALLQT